MLSGDARFRFGIEKKRKDFRQQISLIKLLFDLPLLEHHNIRPLGVNALNGESIIRYLFPSSFVVRTEWNGRKVMKPAMATE